MLKFAMTNGSQWRVVPPRSSAVAQQLAAAAKDCAAPMAGLSRKLRNHAEALAVWTFVKKIKAEVYRTKVDMRVCVPQYNGWRVLGQLRRRRSFSRSTRLFSSFAPELAVELDSLTL